MQSCQAQMQSIRQSCHVSVARISVHGAAQCARIVAQKEHIPPLQVRLAKRLYGAQNAEELQLVDLCLAILQGAQDPIRHPFAAHKLLLGHT